MEGSQLSWEISSPFIWRLKDGTNDSSDAGGVLALSPLAVALAAALIVVQAIASVKFHLGLHTQLALAAVRCVLQLSVLGYILGECRRPGVIDGGQVQSLAVCSFDSISMRT